jgi:hypothetical protein
MNIKQLKKAIYLLVVSLVILGCESVQLFAPPSTPMPALATSPAPTSTSTSTSVATDAFVGQWIEYWPSIPEHATHTITKRGDEYQIEGSSPLTPQYTITNVRMDGDSLKFSERTDTITIEYELRVKDTQTLSVRAKGMSGWRDDIVWKRTT